jgi:hypothetical protein
MPTRKRHLFRWIAAVFAAAAVGAPTALADPRSLDDIDPSLAAAVRQAEAGSLSPDDRPFYRGSSDTLASAGVSPDDRPFARSLGEVEPASVPVEVQPAGFDWGDALIGGTFGLAFALLGAGAVLIAVRHRRSVLRTAESS